ncbi:MAG: HEPN domain-containing protein [Candidatus Hydrogenedentes bacterium]|nr:HEPN domain-containing protein [Candidatus Hydrogenedentota bacterium]
MTSLSDAEKRAKEWLIQADDDLESAMVIFETGRYSFAAFCAHLSIEKSLKALYDLRLNHVAPKIHNLLLLADRCSLTLTQEQKEFFAMLDQAVFDTRYPESLVRRQTAYTKDRVRLMLSTAKENLRWIKQQCQK